MDHCKTERRRIVCYDDPKLAIAQSHLATQTTIIYRVYQKKVYTWKITSLF